MALLALNLETRPASQPDANPPGVLSSSVDSGLTYGSVSTGLLPGRGLLYSFLLHEIAIFSLLLFWPGGRISPALDPPKKWEVTMIPKDALYLPALGGGDSGGQHQGKSAAKSQALSQLTVAAWSKAGVSYPGVQAIISNPPNPTNRIQTILQPELPDPPELTTFAPLPNMVKLARTAMLPDAPVAESLKTDASQPKPSHAGPVIPTIPPLRIAAPPVIDAPKLALPMSAPAGGPVLEATAVPPAAAPPPKPIPARVQALPGSSGADSKTLVALSVMPAPADPKPKIPAAEAHGRFAIVALPNLAMSNLGPGSAVETATPTAVGSGASPSPSAHDATGARPVSVGGSPASSSASIGGPIAATGTGAASSGAGRNASGASTGGMTIKGAAYGSGPGSGTASGSGSGAGPAPGAFAGMTIQGGEWPNGMPAGVASQPSSTPDPGTYGMTVVSTASSGGGLGDFGVFYDEPVFTVYIRMATDSDPAAPSWTMEYAALHAGEAGGGKIAPPYPAKKEVPAWPTELVPRYRNQLIIVFVVIDESGKVARVKSMDTPNVAFNAPLLASLQNWEFRPATTSGRPIAVRALLGVPISLPATSSSAGMP